jgi:hypothetical protein
MTASFEHVETPNAACAIFRNGPPWDGVTTATIGRYRSADEDSGAALLEQVKRKLAAEGVASVLGPMDGDTWHGYRAITETDGSPLFLMEPTAGPDVAAVFQRAGFSPVSSYMSARAQLDDAMAAAGTDPLSSIRIESWDGANAEGLLGQLFAMSSTSFSSNAFYKPISREEFLVIYQPAMAAVDPRLVLFAKDMSGAIQGFLFAIPNHVEGPRPHSVILKTYASRMKGVGRLLADELHRRARGLGFTDVIHALMHEDNHSRASSALFGATVFRRYTLFGLKLAR